MEVVPVPETAPLLETDSTEVAVLSAKSPESPRVSASLPSSRAISPNAIRHILPLAFTAAFAIAATSATTVYAYAAILCDDPSQCADDDRSRYTATVALASFIANATGIVAVGFLRPLVESRPKSGLCFWLVCRALGVGFLILGVSLRSISVAICGRLFEGLASDNILHYSLAAVYVHEPDPARFSRLMGTSLALYMIGMSISPSFVTILPSFTSSFIVAIAILGFSLLYLLAFVPNPRMDNQDHFDNIACPGVDHREGWKQYFRPITNLIKNRRIILSAMAVFFYNCTQAYLFPLIMVDAALRFNATSKENGYIISIAATTSSIYLLFISVILPRIKRSGQQQHEPPPAHVSNQEAAPPSPKALWLDVISALISMSAQLVTLPFFSVANSLSTFYGLVVLVSLGLGAPSYMKSHAVAISSDRNSTLACLAVLESLGGLISPIFLGAIQSKINSKAVFAASSSFVGSAMLCIIMSWFLAK
ncbi:major facilitator superfamily domain-containing protein [Xylaria bambusicola]|uniref:major facilitator superfamily domain-containing protein n=1 Tax=Xylaria bambusicola TaxID=326684 RepID=UPI0020079309|nr:major facilitator superfamily domain-containing protein [Xylaria bambusicola]KAI0517009.1 major facilitator superfamily domain-containing protein [Xylaria bambusicola]